MIKGIQSDTELFALNGIISFYANTDLEHEAIDLFESTYPYFHWHTIEIRKMG